MKFFSVRLKSSIWIGLVNEEREWEKITHHTAFDIFDKLEAK